MRAVVGLIGMTAGIVLMCISAGELILGLKTHDAYALVLCIMSWKIGKVLAFGFAKLVDGKEGEEA